MSGTPGEGSGAAFGEPVRLPVGSPIAPGPRVRGLSELEARARLLREGPNEIPRAKRRRWLGSALEIVREPMILFLLASGTVYLLLGDPEEALLLLGSIGLVIWIELYQERRTGRALEALRDLSSPKARVIRDGRTKRIPGRELVRGDRVLVSEGDRIPADAVVLSALNLAVDESPLTGESVPVRKSVWPGGAESGRPGGDDTSFGFSGTLVVRGRGVLKVTATGGQTHLGLIGKTIESEEPPRTRLQRDTSRLVRLAAAAGLTLCAAVTVGYGITRHSWLEAILAGLALAISLMPEEFPVILTVFLALGAWRLARRRVLTRRPAAIESLGTATVLCVDKTGTLTQNRMEVRFLLAGETSLTLRRAAIPPESMHSLLEYAILASQEEPTDPMDRAVKELGDRTLADTERLHPDWTLVHEYPLSRRLLALSQVWSPAPGVGLVVAAKGAPEAIVELCHLNREETEAVASDVTAAAGRGLRMLGVARATWTGDLPEDQHAFAFEFLGLIGFEDPIRPNVPAALQECAAAGIRTVMVTGDYPDTARAVARELGLRGAAESLTGTQLDLMDEDVLRAQVARMNVYSRMAPEHKLRLVRALHGNGDVVAMTGDGVNDAPALKAAHIGIGMGLRGTDVAREAAALVLLDDDFASLVRAVRLGRRIFDNLRKAAAFVIAVHVPIAGIALIPILLGWPLILFPVHIVFIELIIDPICSIAFEAEPDETDVMRRPPRRAEEGLFTWKTWLVSLLQGAGVLAVVFAIILHSKSRGIPEAETRALAFAALVLGNLGLVLTNRSWSGSLVSALRRPNPMLSAMVAAALVVLAASVYVPLLARLFRFESLQPSHLIMALGGAIICIAWCELLKLLRR